MKKYKISVKQSNPENSNYFMRYLNISKDELISYDAFHTAKEISEQPELWRKIAKKIFDNQSWISSYIRKCLDDVDSIILKSAVTSSYVGFSLQGLFSGKSKKPILVIPTTDIVTHPADYFSPDMPVMLVSYARSGNSPESKAAIGMADMICTRCYHLINYM